MPIKLTIMKVLFYLLFISLFGLCQKNFKDKSINQISSSILPGANNLDLYLPLLKSKRVALVVNQSSRIDQNHLVDTLLCLDINITKIFSPEHGFRGEADAGQKVDNTIDPKTGIPLISLYGAKKAPSKEDLNQIDIIVFDIQDVGVRFYTYISTLHFILQTANDNEIPVIILDRPNPNIHYIDGPVLQDSFKSFVGMHNIPVVYGMTIGEYGMMIKGEKWIESSSNLIIEVIPCTNYNRASKYILPVKPSPNLTNQNSILHYPSLCFFEPTTYSIGRGTNMPFEVLGHPSLLDHEFSFTPISSPGARSPKHKDTVCYGIDLRHTSANEKGLNLAWLIKYYQISKDSNLPFFTNERFFDLLAGSDQLRRQLLLGKSEEEIKNSWQVDLAKFKEIRKKYLLYPEH